MYEAKAPIFLDELREFAIRDPELIQPGDEIVFVGLPPLTDPALESSQNFVSSERAIVMAIGMKSPRDLHPNGPDYPSAHDLKLIVEYRDDEGRGRYRYGSDSGLVPYTEDPENYNSHNFTVKLSDLREHGYELVEEASVEYLKKLESFNQRIRVSSLSYDDCY